MRSMPTLHHRLSVISTDVVTVSISRSCAMCAVGYNTAVLTLWRCGAQEAWTVLLFDSDALFGEPARKSRAGIVAFACRTACRVHLETVLADLGTDVLVAGTREAATLRDARCKAQESFSAHAGHSKSSEPNFQHSDPRMKLSIRESKIMNSFGVFFSKF
jgi:hypothetical protein